MRTGTNPAAGLSRGVQRLWDCGVTWAHLQPEPGRWTFDALDRIVDGTDDDLMLVLGHPPAWAARGGPDGREAAWLPPGTNRPPASPALWREYVATVASRYRGRIRWYQVWNEPADPAFYTGGLPRLARLTAAAEEELVRCDPEAALVSAPLQPRPASGWPRAGERLMDAYREVGYPVDIWACHIYPETGQGWRRWVQMVEVVRDTLARHGQQGRPLWVTETNLNVPSGPALDEDTARDEVRRIEQAAAELGVAGVIWYAADGWFGIPPGSLAR